MKNEVSTKKIKLLILETDEQVGNLLSNFFNLRNFITYICNNYLNLDQLLDFGNPDILIVDGFQHIESYDLTNVYIPIVLLTTQGLKNDRIRGYKIGFDAYIVKPFDPDELVAIIYNLITKKRNLKELKFLKHRLNILNLKIKQREPEYNNAILTLREKEVLGFIQLGLNNKQIADTMTITTRSVEKYITRIFDKLKIQNRLQVLAYYKSI